MTGIDFGSRMRGLPDEGVVRIAFSRDGGGYVPEAVDAARAEVARRGLSESEIFQALLDAQEERENDRLKVQRLPGNVAWLLYLILIALLGVMAYSL